MPNNSTPSRNSHKAPVSQQTIAATFSGPIPPPEILAKYNHIVPGFAERIMVMAENQAKHRQELESKELNAQIEFSQGITKEIKWGQWFAFIISIFTVGTGGLLVWHGQPTAGTLFAGASLASIVYAFINGRKEDKSKA